MKQIPLALFLVLFGITGLLATQIPAWVTAVAALAAGAGVLIEAVKK